MQFGVAITKENIIETLVGVERTRIRGMVSNASCTPGGRYMTTGNHIEVSSSRALNRAPVRHAELPLQHASLEMTAPSDFVSHVPPLLLVSVESLLPLDCVPPRAGCETRKGCS